MSLSPLEGENQIGNASRQSAAMNSLILTNSSSFKQLVEIKRSFNKTGLYQGIAAALIQNSHTTQTVCEMARKLALAADDAYAFRRFDIVGCVGALLVRLPLPRQFEGMGHYYQALGLNRGGRGDTLRAGFLFELVADSSPSHYRARALLALGTNSLADGDSQTAICFYRDAMRVSMQDRALDPATFCIASRVTAVIRGIDGDHRSAVSDLERLFPLAQRASLLRPYAYYDYLNALAVELGEVGRLEEAKNISRIVLASPFAHAYPEWRETREGIERRGRRPPRSVVAITQSTRQTNNLVLLPLPELSDSLALQSPPASQRARVFSIQEWKNKMPKQSNGDTQDKTPRPTTAEEKQTRLKELGKLTTREKLLMIMNVIGDERVGDDLLLRALIILEGLEPDENQGS